MLSRASRAVGALSRLFKILMIDECSAIETSIRPGGRSYSRSKGFKDEKARRPGSPKALPVIRCSIWLNASRSGTRRVLHHGNGWAKHFGRRSGGRNPIPSYASRTRQCRSLQTHARAAWKGAGFSKNCINSVSHCTAAPLDGHDLDTGFRPFPFKTRSASTAQQRVEPHRENEMG